MTMDPTQEFSPLDELVNCRRCRHCEYGPGSFVRAGQPDVCWGCSGTGKTLTLRDRKRYESWNLQRCALFELALAEGARRVDENGNDYSRAVSSALDLLTAKEPHRVSKMYVSLATGRVDAVVDSLISYYRQNR